MDIVLYDSEMPKLLIDSQEKASYWLDIGVIDTNYFLLTIVFEVTKAIYSVESIHGALRNWSFNIDTIYHS